MANGNIVIFIADFSYIAANQGELSFDENEHLQVLNNESEWWFAMKTTGQVGWIPPSYGHVSEVSPYTNLSDREKLNKRKHLFAEIIQVEATFVSDLDIFIQTIVVPLQARDTSFKRSFLSEPSIAVSFSLIKELYVTCSFFVNSIRSASSADQMAKCYLQFAPSLKLFSQYASENATCLNAIKSFSPQLCEFSKDHRLPDGLTLESCIVLPIRHYPKYALKFQEFVWLTPTGRPELTSLNRALDEVIIQTELVDNTLDDLAASVKLLALQGQFVGNPKIFTTNRKLIREGVLERIRTIAGNVTVKAYYAHLFNDVLIWSQWNNVAGTFKLNKMMELKNAKITNVVSLAGVPNSFALTSSSSVEVFRCPKAEESQVWCTEIDKVIMGYKQSKVEDVISYSDVISSMPKLPTTKAMGNRAACIHNFLASEMRFADLFASLTISVFKPLFEASKGAALQVDQNVIRKSVQRHEESSAFKVQKQTITEQLKIPDIQICLRSAIIINDSLTTLVENIRNQCNGNSWSENICIGNIFLANQTNVLYNQYKSYAEKYQCLLRTIKGPFFSEFYAYAEHRCLNYPGLLVDNMESPKTRPAQYLEFLSQLYQITPQKHPDKQDLAAACQLLTLVSNEVDLMVRSMKNFDKLLEIQASLVVSSGVFTSSNDPTNFVQKLASTERRFIKEGDLKKVCRKSNKTFRFWYVV